MGFSRAQSSIETLIILAIALFLLMFLVNIVYDQITNFNISENQKIAASSIRSLAAEIDDAYFLGPGTVKNVKVVIPIMTDLNKSYIQDKTILLHVAGTDLVSTTRVPVKGIWPNQNGSYVFVITSYSDFVAVSTQPIAFSPSQINETMLQNNNRDVNIIVQNISSIDKNYFVFISFPTVSSTEVTLSTTNVGLFNIHPFDENTITFNLACKSNALGSYFGTITFQSILNSDINLTVPVSLTCNSSQSKLSIYPQSKKFSILENTTSTQSLLLCNNSASSFTLSKPIISGSISNYAFSSFSGTVSPNSCVDLNLLVKTPAYALSNYYPGNITLNFGSLSVSSDLNLVVLQNILGGYYYTYLFAGSGTLSHNNSSYGGVYKNTDLNAFLATGELDWNTLDVGVEAYNDGRESYFDGNELQNTSSLWDSNLVALWHFNDKNSSGYILNSKTGLRDANLNGGADVNAIGLWDTNAGYFDGVNDSVAINNPSYLQMPKFTISTWIKLPVGISSGSTEKEILSYRGSTGSERYGYSFGFSTNASANDGKLQLILGKGAVGGWNVYETTNATWVANKWYHLVVIHSGSSYSFYVDGVPEATGSAATPVYSFMDSIASISGLFNANGAYGVGANIEEVAIWNRALSSTEVSSLYSSQAGKYVKPNLVGLWHLNDKNSTGWLLNSATGVRDGNLVGGADVNVVGLWGTNAGFFDGVNDFIDVPDSSAVDLTGNFTICAWVNKRSTSDDKAYILTKEDGSSALTNPYTLFAGRDTTSGGAGTSGAFTFKLYDSVNSKNAWVNTNFVYSANTWYHLCVAWNNSLLTGYFFVNDMNVTSNASAEVGFVSPSNSNGDLWVGSGYFFDGIGTIDYFDGSVEDLTIWNRVLSVSEINSIYQAQKGNWFDVNLVAYYKFNEKFDTNKVIDYARGNTGTLTNGADVNVRGLWDTNALYCDGVNDYVDLGNSKAFHFGKDGNDLPFSIGFWVYNLDSGTATYISKWNSTARGIEWMIYDSGTNFTAQLNDDPNGALLRARTDRLPMNTWTRVFVTYDGNGKLAKGNAMKIYYNGLEQAKTVSSSASYSALNDTNSQVLLCNYLTNNSSTQEFNGYLDDVKIYSRALSQAEIQSDYNRFLSAKLVDSNIVDANATADWNNLRVNKTVGYSFGKEIEDWNKLKLMGINELGSSVDSSYLFNDVNLIGLWHLNDKNSNEYVLNSKTGIRDGILTGSTVINAVGLWDSNAGKFNGALGDINLGSPASLNLPSALTISAWVKVNSISNYKTIVSNYNLSGLINQYDFVVDNSNKFYLSTQRASGNWKSWTSTAVLSNNVWYNLVVTRTDGTLGNETVKLYLDGVETPLVVAVGGTPTPLPTTGYGNTKIGRSGDYAGNYFNGSIEEVAIWNRTLNSNEVSDLYNSQKPMFENGLVGLWHLNDKNFSGWVLNSVTGVRDGNFASGADVNISGLWDTNAGWFNGSTGYINFPNSTTNNILGPLTVSAWAKTNTPAVYQNLVTKTNNGTTGWMIGVYQNKAFFQTNNAWTQNGAFVTTGWHHYAGIFTGSQCQIYYDGTLSNSAACNTPITNANQIRIGRYDGGVDSFWNGLIDEVAIWNRALSASEVLDLYRKGVSKLDLNIYSCSDANCNSKTSSLYLADTNNGLWMDLNSSLINSRYLGLDAIFTKAKGFEDQNAGTFYVGSYLKDFNVSYVK